MKNLSFVSRILWPLVLATGCAVEGAPPIDEPGDVQGIEEVTEGLTDLSAQCSFVSGTGVATLALATGDVALVNKSSAGLVVVNGYSCGGATSTTLKKLVVTGSGGAETLILDYMGGTFAPGVTGAVGVDVDLGGGTDALKIRGSKAVDAFVFGASGITINADTLKDIAFANVETFVATLSDGNDTFSAAGSATTGATSTAAVTVYGGAGDDTLRGGAGDDTFYGNDGNDTFTNGTAADGADTFNGGAGTDTVDYSLRTAAVTVTIDGTADDGAASETDDIKTDVEAVKGGLGDDDLTGSTGADTPSGGTGNDTLAGLAGADTLNGDAGNDTFDEGAASNGADTMNGGAGTDTVDYSGRSNAVTINLDTTANDGEALELDKVVNDVENGIGGGGGDTIVGSASDNVFDGGAGADTISGGVGNDTLKGGAGIDTLNGDAGDDVFDEGSATSGADAMHGGAGTDTVNYSARTNDLTVVMDGATGSGEASEGDTIFTDVENLTGGAGDDALTGNAFDNQIEGGAGVDTITGLAGDDVIDGNAGADDVDCGLGDADILLDSSVGTVANCEL
ncbi:MAG: calcium-binding protein [Deltaproteobacteria bacterium]|nr:calcium-binding protein [Deltaproteobacteria bacterium]